MSDAERHLAIDLTGTLLHHGNLTPLPLMQELLQSLLDQDWRITAVTRFNKQDANTLLKQFPGITAGIASANDKATALQDILHSERSAEVLFVDDKPENLLSVNALTSSRLKVIGFCGSNKYAPDTARVCFENGIDLALSPLDLAEQLKVPINTAVIQNAPVEELLQLVPGLHHPFSNIAGETVNVNHRWPTATLFESRLNTSQLDLFAGKLGLLRCSQCCWKGIFRVCCKKAGIEPEDVLCGAYRAEEYTLALSLTEPETQNKLKPMFETAFTAMEKEITSFIGPADELPADRQAFFSNVAFCRQQCSIAL